MLATIAAGRGPARLVTNTLLTFLPCAASADVLYLRDGSRLAGELRAGTAAGYVIATGFAGEITVPVSAVTGISTDAPVMVGLDSRDRVRGRLEYDAEADAQRLTGTAFGTLELGVGDVAAVWPPGQDAPAQRHAEQAHRAELARVKAEHAAEVKAVEERLAGYEDPWSGRITAGLDGASGNAQRLLFSGRAEARRETRRDRLMLFAEGTMQEQNKVLTEKEIRLGANIERDIGGDWYAFARQELEKDKFENLELRSQTLAGIGHFLIRKPAHEWKARAGLGYQFESFENGIDNRQGIISLGYDYRVEVNEWLRFTHNFTYFPAFDSPLNDYRLDSNMGFEIPLGRSDLWSLRLGLRHEYDNIPPPGTKSLDTTYGADIVVDIP
ncbi:MAG: DUF481 domain-containing protein [Gammaproteobacteria bacterium]